ncbi:phosphate:Na+ symporter [Marinilabilia salmonicolor]|jgi:phosphate:Na+ symporter|uniref:Na/Pi cotransporter family protein n=1 Tax=Marinilabilia salmonicolor TaxID=989 RepID=UPI000D06F0A0|nr:Na/Pi cotransporter family protein [Marinilabilia salmonicolor]PRY99992.1 phosphate:Na+ symporter [Marinilabilia salmonicolor]
MNYFLIFIQLLGGLGFFLLGMDQLSSGMKSLAGRQMRHVLEKFTATKGGGVVFGILLTVLFQSSSAASVVMVGFVDAALLSLGQTLAVMLGTGIGTTITAQIIAFKLGTYSLGFVGIGFLFKAFGRRRWSYSGQIVMALGILFYGMDLMSSGMEPLGSMERFTGWLVYLQNPVWGVVAGTIFTAMIQSSAAFIGIVMTLTATGLLSVSDALPLILGTNIGTTVTALIASLNSSIGGKRLAVANTLFRVAGVFIMIWLLGFWEHVTWTLSGDNASGGRFLANAHTIFNVFMTLIFLPFTGIIGSIVNRMVPEKKKKSFHLNYLKPELIGSGEMMLPFLKKEVGDMGRLVIKMVDDALSPFFDRESKVLDNLRSNEKMVDNYREEINRFLVSMNEKMSAQEWSDDIYRFLHVVNELEQIADIVSVNIARQGEKWLDANIHFSEEGGRELRDYQQRCVKQLARAMQLLEDWEPEQAMKMKRKYRKYALMAYEMEMQHYKRLLAPSSRSVESSKVHIELLNLLRMINSHATNIGRMVFMEEEGN